MASFVLLAMAGPVALTGVAGAPAALSAPASSTAATSGSFASSKWGDPLADLLSWNSDTNQYDATKDPGSLWTVTKEIGARDLWGRNDSKGRKITGQGVTVALLDSGVASVAGLNTTGKIVNGPDLSLESGSSDLQYVDDYGHGTHLAGIIGAKDSGTTVTPSTSPSTQLGVAPDATILPIKLATADGATDVSQVIAAVDWTVEHKNDDPSKPIRVINLSYGTNSTQAYTSDPLAAAVENAWKAGIVVVVSAGNDGNTGSLTDPAYDPYVIAVGASDSQGRTDLLTAKAASFSQVGSAARHADILAPGTSIASLRDPGSYVDQNHPEGLVAKDTTGRLFRGSGTSQAAAVTSGAIALLLQDHPELTPDQVKGLLMANADKVTGSTNAVGSGVLDIGGTIKALDGLNIANVLTVKVSLSSKVAGLNLVQSYPRSNGSGSLEAARGGSYVFDPDNGIPLSGEVDVQGLPWNGAAWFKASSAGTSWVGGQWLGTVWAGNTWTTVNTVKSYANAAWTGARWSGARWSGARWSGARWSGARWSSADWSGARWSGARWSGARWSGARWSGTGWGMDS